MKIISAILVALWVSTCWTNAQTAVSSPLAPNANLGQTTPSNTPYAVVSKGANQQVWQKTTYETLPSGQTFPHIRQFTELATGLHYWKNGQWVDSKEEIDILPNGTAAATQGQHQVYFPGNIYQGEIQLVTPDGKQLQTQLVGLSYDDGSNSVLIAAATNSIGQLVGPNQVLYPDAFTGLKADLLYIYTKAGFEQDVILREQPPTPESLGLSANARLQVLTEFFDPPRPAVTTTKLPNQAGIALINENLDFGVMKMVPGRAFLVGNNSSAGNVQVAKQWVQVANRQILVEEVPVSALAAELETLPLPQGASAKTGTTVHLVASHHWQLPPPHLVQAEKSGQFKRMAAATSPKQGLVLDYQTVNANLTNYTFQGDTTYYISGEVDLSGTNTLEGGAVLKIGTNYLAGINVVNGVLNCQTAPYRPAIFTAVDDNSVGETISDSTGNPTNYYGNVGLSFEVLGSPNPHDLRMAYMNVGIVGLTTNSIRNIQFVNCYYPIGYVGDAVNIILENVLVQGGVYAVYEFAGGPGTVSFENCTLHNVEDLGQDSAMTNCLIVGVENTNYNIVGVSNVFLSSDAGVFQTVGAGANYLAANSPYRNAGTTNIDSALLAALRQKTTYPPIVYSNTTISVATTFSPQAQRDTDMPDLGYHYDPIDYVFGGVDAASNLTFTAGTAVGWFELPGSGGPGYGISLPDSSTATFNGTVTLPCVLTRYDTVQEGGNGLWTDKGWLAAIIAMGDTPSDASLASQAKATFTHFAALANDPNYVRDYTSDFVLQANDCEFWSGDQGGYGIHLYLTNCLINGLHLGIEAESSGDSALVMRNCTMREGDILTIYWEGAKWPTWIENCVFERTDLSLMNDPSGGDTNITYCNFNAFLTNGSRLPILGTHDVTNLISYNWQSSWLGNYYLPTNSPLIDHGSTTADQIGLYHFTTQTNQVKETNSIVDIGYHYVAVDTNGIPIDTNGDGIPDYLEDANGNGLVDSGEIGWNIFGDLGLKVLITRPRNGGTLP